MKTKKSRSHVLLAEVLLRIVCRFQMLPARQNKSTAFLHSFILLLSYGKLSWRLSLNVRYKKNQSKKSSTFPWTSSLKAWLHFPETKTNKKEVSSMCQTTVSQQEACRTTNTKTIHPLARQDDLKREETEVPCNNPANILPGERCG